MTEPTETIVLTFVTGPGYPNPSRLTYKTLSGARNKAHKMVGANPKRDPDGYAVNRKNGVCLFVVSGCKYSDLFDNWPEED